jgi:hypothetical protein
VCVCERVVGYICNLIWNLNIRLPDCCVCVCVCVCVCAVECAPCVLCVVCYTCSEREYFSHTIMLLFAVVVVDCRGTIFLLSYLLTLFSFAASVFCVVSIARNENAILAVNWSFGDSPSSRLW